MVFDNSKIKRLVPEFRPVIPFWQGAKEIIAWYEEDKSRQVVDERSNELQDRLIEVMKRARPDEKAAST
jgi:hypothetical protein